MFFTAYRFSFFKGFKMTAVFVPVYPGSKYVSRAFRAAHLKPTFTAPHFFRSQLGQSDRPENVVIVNAPDIETAEAVVLAKTGRRSLISEPATSYEIAHRLHQNTLGAFLVFRGRAHDGTLSATDIMKTPTPTRDSALYFADRKCSLISFFNKAFPEPKTPATLSPRALKSFFARRPQDGTCVFLGHSLPLCSL